MTLTVRSTGRCQSLGQKISSPRQKQTAHCHSLSCGTTKTRGITVLGTEWCPPQPQPRSCTKHLGQARSMLVTIALHLPRGGVSRNPLGLLTPPKRDGKCCCATSRTKPSAGRSRSLSRLKPDDVPLEGEDAKLCHTASTL